VRERLLCGRRLFPGKSRPKKKAEEEKTRSCRKQRGRGLRKQTACLSQKNQKETSLCFLLSHLFLIYLRGRKERESRPRKEEMRAGVWTALGEAQHRERMRKEH
jgi:hypothetical protein